MKGLCVAEACDRQRYCRELCTAHYQRLRKYGTVDDPRLSPIARLLSHIEIGDDGCWLWQAATIKDYGVTYLDGKNVLAHRAMYQLLVGPIPDGLQLDHLCRRPPCICPDHLEPVTGKVNLNRGIVAEVNRARQLAITHCPQDHAYDESNTYRSPASGARQCRTCMRDRHRARRLAGAS